VARDAGASRTQTHTREKTALNCDENDGDTTATTATAANCRSRIVTNRRQRHDQRASKHTRARASRWQRHFVVPHDVPRRLSRGAVLEVRKRTTTTHHRLATALLPLSAFPCELRAAAVSLSPPAPLTLALSHTRVYRAS